MTDTDPSRPLVEAVRRTLQRACEVTVRVRATATPTVDDFAPGLAGDGQSGTGAVDFLSDRASLGDGRWRLTEGDVGTWGMLHPRFPLEAILQARERVAVLRGRHFRVELDRDKLSALSDAGVSPDWRPSAEVVLSDGIVRRVQLGLFARTEPKASMVTVVEYRPVNQLPAINLPAVTAHPPRQPR